MSGFEYVNDTDPSCNKLSPKPLRLPAFPALSAICPRSVEFVCNILAISSAVAFWATLPTTASRAVFNAFASEADCESFVSSLLASSVVFFVSFVSATVSSTAVPAFLIYSFTFVIAVPDSVMAPVNASFDSPDVRIVFSSSVFAAVAFCAD